jgi:hypothetical protein
MIYGRQVANASTQHRKQECQEVYSVKVAAPVYLDWSDKPITFDQGDHPDYVPSPGRYPLVVDPIIGNVRLSKVLMDGGSSLNIIYAETLELLGVGRSEIRAGAAPFHGIAPGKRILRRFDEEKRRVIGEEVHKLMAAGFIKEVFHPEWLANPVLVKKKGGKWRMCVDYTGLNKACPKVPYPLPRIDQIVDSTAGCETLSFLYAYSGYHQIKMKESDQLATSFITPFGMYCYTTMPFGLRNAGATYQRCMNHVFGEHIGRTVEAYVDDIVVKTRKASDLISDLEVTFRCLKAKSIKLNPEKCVFGVPRGMLLGFIVSERGIEANPEKIVAITNMGPIKDLKGVQRVMGCLAALSRFISHLGEKGLPLYRLLRKAERFTWTPEAEEALRNLKVLLTNAPILVPLPQEKPS